MNENNDKKNCVFVGQMFTLHFFAQLCEELWQLNQQKNSLFCFKRTGENGLQER